MFLQYYLCLELSEALTREQDFCRAVQELTYVIAIYVVHNRTPKDLLNQIFEDVTLAITQLTSNCKQQEAVKELVEQVARKFPLKKKQSLLQLYKSKQIELHRKRKGSLGDYEDEDDQEMVAAVSLPQEVIEIVVKRLDPISLLRASCVNKHWSKIRQDNNLWENLSIKTLKICKKDPNTKNHYRHLLRKAGVSTEEEWAAKFKYLGPKCFGQLNSRFLLPWKSSRMLVDSNLRWSSICCYSEKQYDEKTVQFPTVAQTVGYVICEQSSNESSDEDDFCIR